MKTLLRKQHCGDHFSLLSDQIQGVTITFMHVYRLLHRCVFFIKLDWRKKSSISTHAVCWKWFSQEKGFEMESLHCWE